MTEEEPDTTTTDTAAEDAAFGTGFGGTEDKPAAKPDKPDEADELPDCSTSAAC